MGVPREGARTEIRTSDAHLDALKIILDYKAPPSDFDGTQAEITRRLRELRDEKWERGLSCTTANVAGINSSIIAPTDPRVQQRRKYLGEQARL